MFIYVKKQHVGVTPGLEQFVMEFMSDAAAGRGGYLQDRGLVPLPADQLAAQQRHRPRHDGDDGPEVTSERSREGQEGAGG